ncbi:MAG: MBL fold metallo-hydrolase [Sandaracinaceae bacterium]|nr:MBL fold metallo-hydrolase [Sandaracinaceae bacterium]
MRLVPLGVGDAFSAKHYSSCLLVEHDAHRILIDCPHPIRKILAEAGQGLAERLDLDSIDAVVLTHLHADHASGLEGYGYFMHFVLRRRARLVVHPAVQNRLWDGHLAAGMEHLGIPGAPDARAMALEDYFEIVPLRERAPARIGPFTIECRRTLHHVPTTALRVHAGERSLGYSADTSFDRALIAWLAEADLVVHETNYGAHTPYASLAELPGELRSKLRLIHYPDDFDLDASVIEPLRQGRSYSI